MDNKKVLEALASDLKRVVIALQRGSFVMARRFSDEALQRRKEIYDQMLEPYVVKFLDKMEYTLHQLHDERAAEDALMESVILQNYIQKRLTVPLPAI